jgi:hypothetical protein
MELSRPDALTAFNSDGYTVETNAGVNTLNNRYLDLALKADPKSGFAIETYTGTGTSSRSVPHSLNAVPTFMIVKRRDTSGNWVVYHKTMGATQYLYVNTNASAITNIAAWNNTEPTSSNFTVGSGLNTLNDEYVAYLFTDTDVYQTFTYTGNGAVTGPYVDLGGKPLSIPFLKSASTTTSWLNMDTARNQQNPIDVGLYPDLSNAESALTGTFTALSTGLKVSTSSSLNGNGSVIIGLAILQSDQKYSNAF